DDSLTFHFINLFVRRINEILALLSKIFFDDAVFQRVEGDHRASSTRLEGCHSLRKCDLLYGQLLVDDDSQRLKGLRGGVGLVTSAWTRFLDDSDQLTRRMKRSGLDDSACDSASIPIFAVLEDDVGQFALLVSVDDVCRTHHQVRTKAH